MYLSTLSILLPLIFGAIFFKSLTRPIKILFGYIVVAALLEFLGAILFFQGKNNMPLYHIYTFFEFTILSLVYYTLFNQLLHKIGVLILSVAFLVYMANLIITHSAFDEFNTITRTIESAILILYFLTYILHSSRENTGKTLELNPYFILTSGLLIYFAGTVCVFLFLEHLEGNSFLSAWSIHSVLNIFLNVIYAVVLWKSHRNLKI